MTQLVAAVGAVILVAVDACSSGADLRNAKGIRRKDAKKPKKRLKLSPSAQVASLRLMPFALISNGFWKTGIQDSDFRFENGKLLKQLIGVFPSVIHLAKARC